MSSNKHVSLNKHTAVSNDKDDGNVASLPAQAFSVFQDVLAAEVTEENRHLREENEQLHGPFHDALSTVRVVILGREYELRLEDGAMMIPANATTTANATTAPVEHENTEENVESVPTESVLASDEHGAGLDQSPPGHNSGEGRDRNSGLRGLRRRFRRVVSQRLPFLGGRQEPEQEVVDSRSFQVPINGAESVPLLSLANSIFDMIRGGNRVGGVVHVERQQKLDVYLGRFHLGSLGMMFSGGELIIREDPRDDSSHRLLLFLSDVVFVEGRVTGISIEDFDGGYEELNQQLKARILMGAPARIHSEDAAFTIETVGLKMVRGLEETLSIALAHIEVEQSGLPQDQLRGLTASAIGGGPLCRMLEQKHELMASNLKLNAIRDRLQTIDIIFQSGSSQFKFDRGHVESANAEGNGVPNKWSINLLDSVDGVIRIPFNDLHTVEITIAGIKVSGKPGFVGLPVMGFDEVNRLHIEIPFGLAKLHGVLDLGDLGDSDEAMQSVTQNFNGNFMSALTGVEGVFPGEVGWLLYSISFDLTAGGLVESILKKLNVSVEEQLQSESEEEGEDGETL